MINIMFLSEEALLDLRANYEGYKENYYNKNDAWFNDYLNQPGYLLESKLAFNNPKLNYNENYTTSDRENVKILYDSFKHLTASQATQERLWSGLAHSQLREISYYRSENELSIQKDERINTAMFFKNGAKRSLFVHILAGLWWAG